MVERAAALLGDPSEASACPNIPNCEGESQPKCERKIRDTVRMAGKPRRDTPTREGQRFSWLLLQLERKGMTQVEICRRTGIAPSHLNQLRHIERGSRSGIGAEIVRKVKDGLQIDPGYFFDDYEGEKQHELFLLSAKRDEKRVAAIEDTVAKDQRQLSKHNMELAELRAQLVQIGQEQSATRAELRELIRTLQGATARPAGRRRDTG
jgi:transcriptional regulator with XRE-family HTH domain